MFNRIAKRTFCTINPYHHDFNLGKFEKTSFDYALAALDFARIFFYGYITLKVFVLTPSLLAFRHKKFFNNPDYILCDNETYHKMKIAKIGQ